MTTNDWSGYEKELATLKLLDYDFVASKNAICTRQSKDKALEQIEAAIEDITSTTNIIVIDAALKLEALNKLRKRCITKHKISPWLIDNTLNAILK